MDTYIYVLDFFYWRTRVSPILRIMLQLMLDIKYQLYYGYTMVINELITYRIDRVRDVVWHTLCYEFEYDGFLDIWESPFLL